MSWSPLAARLVALVILPAAFHAPSANAQNLELGFERGKPGETPAEWMVPTKGWKGEIWAEDATSGDRSARLSLEGESDAPFGNLMRMVDARPYRNRKVRLRAKIRVEKQPTRALMWLRVDRAGGQRGFFDNMGDRPVVSNRWTEAVIDGEIAPDAEQIALGVMSMNGGTVYVDDMQLIVTGESKHQPASPPKPLTDRELENLIAATRLLAYVRFFHPSDEVIAVDDWNGLAVAWMEQSEEAKNAEDLAKTLRKLIAPVAPGASVWAGDVDEGPNAEEPPDEATHFRYWVHNGCGRVAKQPSIYSTVVKRVPIFGKAKDDASPQSANNGLMAPPPVRFITRSLGEGVACRIPLMVPVGKEGSLPKSKEASPWASSDEVVTLTPRNRSTRLAAVATLWGVMEHFYPYFEEVDIDWDADLLTALRSVSESTDDDASVGALKVLVAQLRDGHGNVFRSGGAGQRMLPILLDWSGDDLLIVGKHTEVPGQVSTGDVLLAIDGEPIEALADAKSAKVSAATDGWRRYILSQVLMTQPMREAPYSLKLRKPDGTEYHVEMALIPRALIEPELSKPEDGTELVPGIVYFDLNGKSGDALDAVFEKLQAAKGLIFDLRGYPGDAAMKLLPHLTDAQIASAQWRVPVITMPDREGWKWRESAWDLAPRAPRLTPHVAFLTDGRAISYAESIMGIVEHYKLGEIVGSTTAGTNGNVNPFGLPGGYRISWTGMNVRKHDGSAHHGVGIQPTVPVAPTPSGVAAGQDEVLEKAVELLKAHIAK